LERGLNVPGLERSTTVPGGGGVIFRGLHALWLFTGDGGTRRKFGALGALRGQIKGPWVAWPAATGRQLARERAARGGGPPETLVPSPESFGGGTNMALAGK